MNDTAEKRYLRAAVPILDVTFRQANEAFIQSGTTYPDMQATEAMLGRSITLLELALDDLKALQPPDSMGHFHEVVSRGLETCLRGATLRLDAARKLDPVALFRAAAVYTEGIGPFLDAIRFLAESR